MGTLSKRTAGRRQAILKAIRNGHGFASAAAAVGISFTMFKDWRADDPKFQAECLDAAEFRDDVAEHALYTRGVHKGDTLALLAHLRAHRPEKYHRKMLVALGGDPNAPPIATAEVTGAWIYPRAASERPISVAPVIEAIVVKVAGGPGATAPMIEAVAGEEADRLDISVDEEDQAA
jgi:hypothetical protein